MFAGSGTGGIPGSGTDRSATGPATGQVTAGLDTERAGDSRTVLGCGVGAGADTRVCESGRKITRPTATTVSDTPQGKPRRTAATVVNTPRVNARRIARWPVGQPTLLMPILPRPGPGPLPGPPAVTP